ncbi:hypothetical protein [Streptomyces venezuelae]|uniref:hypothetical protein n=1 Tax=Streptomyces venezuelae TaxID=54571 RepID=UPI0016875C2F|nr:hypothetical protein [Streptomyces venezuelae]
MSTTPQMSQLGQQQGRQYESQQQHGPQQYGPQQYGPQQYGQQQSPSTAPPQQSQQQYGQQGIQGQPGMQGQHSMQGQQGMQQVPPQLRQQLQQLGQQQPFQNLLQQFGQQQEQQIPQAQAPEISTQALASNVATAFWDVVEPLPGQAYILYLHVDNAWRAFVDPNPHTHDEVQEAFAYGHQVIGYYDTNNPGYLLAIVITK